MIVYGRHRRRQLKEEQSMKTLSLCDVEAGE